MSITHTNPVDDAVRNILGVILALLSFVFVTALPWNDLGLWPQTEIPTAAIHLGTALAALGIGFLAFRKDATVLGILRSPVVLSLLALVAFTAAAAPLTDSPWRSIHGTLKHGLGVLWHLELAVLSVAAAVVAGSRFGRFVEGALALSATVVVGLYLFPETAAVGRPLGFSEWVGLYAAVVAFLIGSKASAPTSRRAIFAAALFALGIYASGNRTVILSVVACAVLLAAMRFPATARLFSSPARRASFVVLAGVSGIVVMALIGGVLERSAAVRPVASGSQVLSVSPLDHVALQDGALGTLWSRSRMVTMVLGDIATRDTVHKLLVGQGWGAFNTVYEYHAREVPGRMFPSPIPSASMTYWDAQKAADFHGHNLPVEALLSGGVPALVLWFAVIASLAAASRRGLVAATGIMVGSLFWFPVNHMTVALAAILAVGAVPVPATERFRSVASLAVPLPAVVMSAIMIVAGAQIFSLASVEHQERYFAGVEASRDPKACATIRTVMLPEDEVNMSLYEVLMQRIVRSGNKAKEIYDRTTNVINLSCTMRGYYESSTNIRALVTSLEKRAAFVGIGPSSFGPMVDDIVNWGRDIDRLLDIAPERTEHLAPYLSSLVERSRNKPLVEKELAKYAAKVPESDPIHDYVLALQLKVAGDEAGYKAHLRTAVEKGYANLWPVTAALAAEVAR